MRRVLVFVVWVLLLLYEVCQDCTHCQDLATAFLGPPYLIRCLFRSPFSILEIWYREKSGHVFSLQILK